MMYLWVERRQMALQKLQTKEIATCEYRVGALTKDPLIPQCEML